MVVKNSESNMESRVQQEEKAESDEEVEDIVLEIEKEKAEHGNDIENEVEMKTVDKEDLELEEIVEIEGDIEEGREAEMQKYEEEKDMKKEK